MEPVVNLYRKFTGYLMFTGYLHRALKRLREENGFKGNSSAINKAAHQGTLLCGYRVKIVGEAA